MREVKFKDYKIRVLKSLVKLENSFNPEAIGLSTAEAREKGLWREKADLPSLKELQDKFEEMKAEIEAEIELEERAEDNSELSKELDALVISYLDKEDDLGLTAIELATFNLLRDYAVQDAIVYLQENSSLTEGG